MNDHLSPRGADALIAQLPLPDDQAQAHSLALVEKIRAEIRLQGGSLPFDRYMEMALYEPGLGYYTAGARKFGAAGDFITSPEISPLFAQCLARQCQQVLVTLEQGDLLEVGAGSGILAADLLAELQRLDSLPGCYQILELSPDLQQRQRQTLQQRVPELLGRVQWITRLPVAGFNGVVVANELLDAMPVQRFRLDNGVLQEQFVEASDAGLTLTWQRSDDDTLSQAICPVTDLLGNDIADYESEINLRASAWIAELAEGLQQGAVFLIDYGHSRTDYYHPERSRGTLMCHYRHRAHPDALAYPGLQDITTHVDFTSVAEAAHTAGLKVEGFTTQAFFLISTGLDSLVAQSDPTDIPAHMDLVQAVKQLTLPSEMGERFKVLGLSRGIDYPLMGFAMRDMRERL